MNNKASNAREKKDLPVDKAATLVLDESRMILPGIQALFGFQLTIVFSDAFTQKLTVFEQRLHLLSIALLLITTMTIMTQAVFHRQTSDQDVDDEFIRVGTRLLLISMVPLAISVCIEFYLISRLIINNIALSLLFAIAMFALFLLFWLVLPRNETLRRLIAGRPQT